MEQLSLFDTSMDTPLVTAEQLEKTIKFMSNKTWYDYIKNKFAQYQATGANNDAYAIYTEFWVNQD